MSGDRTRMSRMRILFHTVFFTAWRCV